MKKEIDWAYPALKQSRSKLQVSNAMRKNKLSGTVNKTNKPKHKSSK
jgi:hypothetical protein